MRIKLSNNEDLTVQGSFNNVEKIVNVLADLGGKIGFIEATGELPVVAAKGTICRLSMSDSVNVTSTLAADGDDFVFPFWAEGEELPNGGQVSNYFYNGACAIYISNDGTNVSGYITEMGITNWDITATEEYDGVFKFEVSPIDANEVTNDWLSDHGAVFVDTDFNIYTSYSQTVTHAPAIFYISDGEQWIMLSETVEATNTLPTVAAAGTFCKLETTTQTTEWQEMAQFSGDINFPLAIYTGNNTGWVTLMTCSHSSSHGGCDLSINQSGDVRVYFDTGGDDGYANINSDGTVTINNKTCILFETAPLASRNGVTTVLPWLWVSSSNLTSFLNNNGKIYQQATTTESAYHLYVSDGEQWLTVGNPYVAGDGISIDNFVISADITAVNPDGAPTPVGELPIGGGRQIFTSVRSVKNMSNVQLGNALCVDCAADLLGEEYVPVLFRRCKTKKRGWMWRHYRPNRNGSDFIQMVEGKLNDYVPMQNGGTIPSVFYITVDGEIGTTNLPQPHQNSQHDIIVSHGTRQYFLKKYVDAVNYVYHNYKAKWGIAFIHSNDFPNQHAIDLSKLVTNIAPFYVYYQWAENHEGTRMSIIV